MNDARSVPFLSFFFLALSLATAGCASPEQVRALDESRQALATNEAANGSAYTYTRSFQSWAGFGRDTTVHVKDDRVIGRDFSEWKWSEEVATPTMPATRIVTNTWSESAAELGTHAGADPAKTLPELYDECQHDILTKSTVENDLTLTFDAAGILAVCSYYPKGCADDCGGGIDISSVSFGR